MKKIILSILIVLILSTTYVYADSIGVGQDATGNGNSDLEDMNAGTNWPNPQVKGVRVTFVDSNGREVSNSIDYLLDSHYDNEKVQSREYYYISSSCSKLGYSTSSRCNEVVSSSTSFISSLEIKKLSEFEALFKDRKTGVTFNINSTSKVANNNFTGMFDGLLRKNNNKLTDEKYSQAVINVFNNLLGTFNGGSLESYKNTNGLYDIFMIFEPISIIKIDNKYYYGTAYELANIPGADSKKIAAAIRGDIPCASRITGSLSSEMSVLPNNSISSKFNSSSYFNGNLLVPNISSCNYNTISYNYAKNAENGIGIGVVWLGTILNTQKTYSCEEVERYYGTTTFPNDFDFSEFNNAKDANINSTWYKANCKNEVTGYNCTPYYEVGTCLEGNDITYMDSSNGVVDDTYWNSCVFNEGSYEINTHKTTNKGYLSYYDEDLSSNYCDIYCIEEVDTKFTDRNITIPAGRHFTFGYSTARGTRTCKAKEIKYDKFEDDLKEANKRVVDAYAEMKAVELANSVDWTRSEKPNCGATVIVSADEYDSSLGYIYTKEDGTKIYYHYTQYTYYPEDTYISYTATGNGYSKTYSVTLSNSCGGVQRSRTTLDYANAKNQPQAIIKEMEKCYSASSIYNFNPQATITYSDNNYYYSGNLDTNTSYTLTKNLDCKNETETYITGCSGSRCDTATRTIKNCNEIEYESTANTTFNLKNEVFRYVLKSNGMSIHSYEINNYQNPNFTTNYIDIGYGNLPVSYDTTNGLYGSMHPNGGQLDIIYTNLGHIQNNTSQIDTVLRSVDTNYGSWQCEYKVVSKLIDEDSNKDIEVIFRPIDLQNPFPDIDASGRNTGSNWCSYDDCSNTNNIVKEYITNNRDVEDYELYNTTPMYTFTLTPSIIKEIRRYNKENSYTSYIGSLNGVNYDYKCNTATGQTCISDYLSHLIDITGAKNKLGTCVDDRYRTYNDPNNFNICRY